MALSYQPVAQFFSQFSSLSVPTGSFCVLPPAEPHSSSFQSLPAFVFSVVPKFSCPSICTSDDSAFYIITVLKSNILFNYLLIPSLSSSVIPTSSCISFFSVPLFPAPSPDLLYFICILQIPVHVHFALFAGSVAVFVIRYLMIDVSM